jgi:thiol:disulfide interchange protein
LIPPLLVLWGCASQTAGPAPGTEGETAHEGEIAWSYDFEASLAQAKQAGKPVMVDVFTTWCAPCKQLDDNVFSRADVAEAGRGFIAVRVDGDKHKDLVNKLKVTGYPTVLFLSPQGEEIGRSVGAVSHGIMLDEMAKAQQRFAGATTPKQTPTQGSDR